MNQAIVHLVQVGNRRIRVLQDVLDGRYCVMGSARGHIGLHEVLWSALQERMGTASNHGQQVHVIGLIIGEMRDWTESRLSFFAAYQERHRTIAKKHRLNHEGGIQPLLCELIRIKLLLLPHS